MGELRRHAHHAIILPRASVPFSGTTNQRRHQHPEPAEPGGSGESPALLRQPPPRQEYPVVKNVMASRSGGNHSDLTIHDWLTVGIGPARRTAAHGPGQCRTVSTKPVITCVSEIWAAKAKGRDGPIIPSRIA